MVFKKIIVFKSNGLKKNTKISLQKFKSIF